MMKLPHVDNVKRTTSHFTAHHSQHRLMTEQKRASKRRLRRTFSSISTKHGKKVWKSAVCMAKTRVEESELFETLQKSCYNSVSADEVTEFMKELAAESQRLTNNQDTAERRTRWKFWTRK